MDPIRTEGSFDPLDLEIGPRLSKWLKSLRIRTGVEKRTPCHCNHRQVGFNTYSIILYISFNGLSFSL